MKLGVLFTGGKDSAYALYLAKQLGYNIKCLISIRSENKDSYMFHTPSIEQVGKQAGVMNIPLIVKETKGIEEEELEDLEIAIKDAKEKFNIEGIVTGAVESVYQSSRIQEICNNLGLEVFNPIWQKNQIELLNDLIKSKFEVIIVGVAAYPLDKDWLGKKIDKKFVREVEKLKESYGINPAGEGGEFETFVLNCPEFSRKLEVAQKDIIGNDNSWRMEIEVE